MANSNDRREVAERLRKYVKTETASADYLWQHLEIAVNGWRGGRFADESYVFGNDVLSRLADLIDPTCHIAPDDWASEQCMGPMLSCDRCGAWLPPINGDYHYCPNCGARVTDGGER